MINPEVGLSAKRLAKVQRKIKAKKAVCVFREPQFSNKIAATAAEGTGARLAVLDPLGGELAAGADFYPNLLKDVAQKLAACLKG